MKKFIQHHELARDRRFIRQENIAADLLAKLPDDVDAVVDLFEKISPVIEMGVRGTAAEPLFDQFGPAFMLMTLNEPIRPGQPGTEERLKMRMHGIFVGELQALEGAGRSLWDFPDSPWEFKMNMARQCWDEARHVQIFEKLLDHVGGEVGMYAESTFLFEAACADDPALRVAGVNRALEGLACDVFRDSIEFAKQSGDEVMEQSMDYVLADELTHVRFGSEWVAEFCKDDPERLKAAREFRRDADRRFNFGGARSAEEGAAIPIAWEDRKFAGFTDEELEDLAALSGEGPKRKTIQRAIDILVERFQAAQNQEPGAAQSATQESA
jgi:uncharacterized ferritin-like protein (DUF455 family)